MTLWIRHQPHRRHLRLWGCVWILLLVCLGAMPAESAPKPSAAGGTAGQVQAPSDAPIQLAEVQLNSREDYSRMIFKFDQALPGYAVQRGDVDEIWLDFGPGRVYRQGRLDVSNPYVEGVAVSLEKGRMVVKLKLKTIHFSFRHFPTPDRKTVVLDLRSGAPVKPVDSPAVISASKGLPLHEPGPKDLAEAVISGLSRSAEPGSDEALLLQAADLMMAGNYPASAVALEAFKTSHPTSPLMEPALFLLAEARFYSAGENIEVQFLPLTVAYTDALSAYPDSRFAPRARLMLGLVHMKMNYLNEAAANMKQVVKGKADGPYAVLAQVYLGRIYLMLNQYDLAKATLESVRELEPKGPFFIDAYYQLGSAYYQEGLFTKANEIFKDILDREEGFYLDHPTILYHMGEGYFHLGRPDLARAYLFHALNLAPEDQNTDVIMARIGDTYKEAGRDREAIKFFSLTHKLYPTGTGGLISLLRLADYGALSAFFEQESYLAELHDGPQAATAEVYRRIIESIPPDSPLLHLAMFKLALAYFDQEDYPHAIEVLRNVLEQSPAGDLSQDARYLFNRALLAEIQGLTLEEQYLKLVALYTTNRDLVNDTSWPEIRHYLAMAHLELGLFDEAVKLFEANKGLTDHEADWLFGLGRAYLELGRNEEAIDLFARFRNQYPDDRRAIQALVERSKAELALGREGLAMAHMEEAIAAAPDLLNNWRIRSHLGQLYLKKGFIEEGISALESALEAMNEGTASAEESFLLQSRLGQAYARNGRKEQAARMLETAMVNLPAKPFPETVYLIARTYKELGMPGQAVTTLDMLKQTPDPFWQGVADQELKILSPNQGANRASGSNDNGTR